MSTKVYAKPGDAGYVVIPEDKPNLIPSGFIEMTGVNPNPSHYVAETDGNWHDNSTYADKRKAIILEKYDITSQLEAITEFLDNKPEKLKEFFDFLKTVKDNYPKT